MIIVHDVILSRPMTQLPRKRRPGVREAEPRDDRTDSGEVRADEVRAGEVRAGDVQNEDRRRGARHALRVPVAIQVVAPEKRQDAVHGTGETRDLSSNGVFLYSRTKIEPGSLLDLVLVLPAELTGGEKSWVCCQARVLRVEEETGSGNFGIAAAIDRLQLLPELAG